MPSRNVADQAGAATGAPKCRAYLWSSGRPPQTTPSTEFSCPGRSCPLSRKSGADHRHTASDSVSPIHKHSGPHIVDTRCRLASGRKPDTLGTPLHWRIPTGIHTGSSEILDAAHHHTTPCGLLKQPDKQGIPSFLDCERGRDRDADTLCLIMTVPRLICVSKMP